MMKNYKKSCVTFLIVVFLASSGCLAQASVSSAQKKTVAFIENALPIDIAQYNITLTNYGVPNMPDIGSYKRDPTHEVLTYSLESEDSTIDVICNLHDSVVYQCQVGVRKGSVITDKEYVNTADAAKSFLEQYQDYSKLDSTKMIAMLSNVDPTKNATITSGDLKLVITHKYAPETSFGDSIDFRWVQTVNGCDYLLVDTVFRDGALSGFIDHRIRYSIGNTTVNISKEQAKAIAMEYIENYSYQMAGDYWISGFNITEEKTVANLTPTVKEGNVLYPHWSVTLYLNQTYPGSVTSLLLGIWADSGEVFFCYHQAYGGSDLSSDSNPNNSLSNDNLESEPSTTSPLPASENDAATPDISVIAVIGVATIVCVGIAGVLFFKKRSN